MVSLDQLENRVKEMELHNEVKDTDKAWETSFTRRIVLAGLTYLAIGLYMQSVGITNPWINAIVPSVGFILSTLSLPFFKKLWLKYRIYSASSRS